MVLIWDSQWQPVEVAPGVYHLKLPIPNNPLGYLNSYLLKDNGSYTLVDCGWPSRLALEALQEQLARLNLKLSDIASVVVTHFHADHLGLARVIREEYGMEIMLSEVEAPYAEMDRPSLRPKIKEWLVSNGVPEATVPQVMKDPFSAGIDFPWRISPSRKLRHGERLSLGGTELEVIWTPGHSPGHICLYDRKRKILFSGDHILPVITPQVSLFAISPPHPLVNYLRSLKQTGELEVELVLPAHEHIFNNLPRRIDGIMHHHEQRVGDLLQQLGDGEKTAFQVALKMQWTGISEVVLGENLPPDQQPGALGETLAHLDLLMVEGRVSCTVKDGVTYFRALA